VEVSDVEKTTIVKLFWGSLIGLAGGLVLLGVAGGLAMSNDVLVTNGPDVVGVKSGLLAGVLIGFVCLAGLVMMLAAGAQFVAWIGAVFNTANLPSKNWFAGLLVIGLLGFVFIANLLYVVAGPDGVAAGTEAYGQQRPLSGGDEEAVPTASSSGARG
jgi:hypothetical protein